MRFFGGWPTALIRKWLTLALIGLGCLAIGVVMLIAVHDMTLFYMSLVLAGLIVGRCSFLYRKIGSGKYETVEGICIRTSGVPLLRKRSLCLLTVDGEECMLALEGKMIPRPGVWYRAYLLAEAGDEMALPTAIRIGYPSVFAIECLGETEKSENGDTESEPICRN